MPLLVPLLLAGLTTPPPRVATTGVPDRVRAYDAIYAVVRTKLGIPSFSRQTGLACNVCHTAFPMLTAFGRQFKLNAYTLTGLQTIGPIVETGGMRLILSGEGVVSVGPIVCNPVNV